MKQSGRRRRRQLTAPRPRRTKAAARAKADAEEAVIKTDAVDPLDLARSVISVPPLPRGPNGAISFAETMRLVEWLSSGGVSTFLFGGNANLYNMGVSEFGTLLDLLERVTPDEGWAIPSVGADFGKAADQIDQLRERDFPTAMLLPASAAFTPSGVATGLRRLADRYGRPLVAYVRAEGFLAPRDLAALSTTARSARSNMRSSAATRRRMPRSAPSSTPSARPSGSSAASASGR